MIRSRTSKVIDAARAEVAGVTAGIVGLGVAELVSSLVPWLVSPLTVVGETVIAVTPAPVVATVVSALGDNAKFVLFLSIIAVILLAGAAIGRLAARSFGAAVAAFGVTASLGVVAAVAHPTVAAASNSGNIALSAVAGMATLRLLTGRATARDVDDTTQRVDGGGRRRFLSQTASLLALGILATTTGRLLPQATTQRRVTRAAAQQLLSSVRTLPNAARATRFDVPGLTPLFTPNDSFYRVDTVFSLDRVTANLEHWRLGVHGMVDAPFELSYDDILSGDLVEADVTLVCVSNEVGGDLVGTARWIGIPLRTLLERAGVREGADQLVGRAVDGWTGGFPTAIALDHDSALLAIGMNGEPLPLEHGWPARLVVPGLYGYVSATKWITEIELTTWDGHHAYWAQRGWATEAPVKMASRIDVPEPNATLAPGPVVVAGVAWAQPSGVSGVQVQVDEADWRDAELAGVLSVDTWRQWRFVWDAEPGIHLLRVRAIDARGTVQTSERAAPEPSGATGWHTVGPIKVA